MNCAEGTPTAALTNTTAAIRAVHGCTDTDANSSDFAIGTPAPRNTATALAPCGGGDPAPSVSSTTPANSANNVSVNSTIVIDFSESVTASASRLQPRMPGRLSSDVHADGVARHDVHADADLAAAGWRDVRREGDSD